MSEPRPHRRLPRPVVATALVLLALLLLAAWLLALQPGLDQVRAPAGDRSLEALAAVVLYVVGFALASWRRRRARRAAGQRDGAVLIVHSSQTGHAEQLAQQSAAALRAAAVDAQVLALQDLGLERLQAAKRALFVAATTGEGDAPDGAARFIHTVMAAEPILDLEYGVLALGDRDYAQFCAWGRRLDGWLRGQGASALFERIEVDKVDAGALVQWRQRLAALVQRESLDTWVEPRFEPWTLIARRWLNRGSVGAPCHHVELRPPAAANWEPGDILTLEFATADGAVQRDYSIGSLAADGAAHLLVRQTRHDDGRPGLGSAWLTQHGAIGDTIAARVRPNHGFRPPDDGRPLIAIGNGTGLSGLRALLKSRVVAGRGDNWLIFGERQRAHDFHYRDEVAAWQRAGLLTTLDAVFSRDADGGGYVQDRLHAQAGRLRDWIARGAAIYVCGSARGMATGVDDALRQLLGAATVDALTSAGRYRRDVY